MNHFVRFLSLLTLLWLIPSMSYADNRLVVDDAWVRMPPPVAETAAVYMTLSNTGDKVIKVDSVKSDAADKVEFHSMEMHGDMMHMAEMKEVLIKPNQPLVFDAGGNHIMLIGLKQTLQAGDSVKLQIKTDDGAIYNIEADVRDMRKHNHDHHGHH